MIKALFCQHHSQPIFIYGWLLISSLFQLLMNKTNGIVFSDRLHAGEQLGRHLASRYSGMNPLVIGVPKGGVEVAAQTARHLDCEMGMIIAKKLPLPGQTTIAFGAVAEDLSVYVSKKHVQKLDPELVIKAIDEQTDEVNRRLELYRGDSPMPQMSGRNVIVVDEGISTGSTMVSVLELCRRQGAATVVIATPVCCKYYDPKLDLADSLEVLVQPDWFHSMSQSYAIFKTVTDQHVLSILGKYAYNR